jgi:glycolate oxidase
MLSRIIKVVGEENYSEAKEDLLAYGTDASMIDGKVLAVVWPKDVEEVRKIVTIASQNRYNLVPRGAGTGLAGGVVPNDSLILDFSRMNRIKASISEQYAEVEPGVIVDVLNSAIAQYGLFFPVIPSSSRACTIGGMIATNAAGNRAVKYGKMIDWLLELEVVDGTGKVYDIKSNFDAFCGTEGTVGIITKAKLKLTKPLEETTLSVVKAESAEEILAKLNSFKSMQNVIAIEFMDRLSSEISGLERSYHLFVEFEGPGGSIQDGAEIKRLWIKREGCWPKVSSAGYIMLEDPMVKDDKIIELIQWLDNNGVPYFGHIGLGILHPAFKLGQNDKVAEMHELVKKLGGSVSGEHGIGISKKSFVSPEQAEKIKQLKKKYNPENILNKGKIIDFV